MREHMAGDFIYLNYGVGGWREKWKGGNGRRGVGDFEMEFRWCLKNVRNEGNNSILERKKASTL